MRTWLSSPRNLIVWMLAMAWFSPDTTAAPGSMPESGGFWPGAIPLSFERNEGQGRSGVEFIARSGGTRWEFAPDGAALAAGVSGKGSDRKFPAGPARLRLSFVDAARNPTLRGDTLLPGRVNWLHGGDPAGWRTNLATYARLRYEQIYPGIDVIFYGNEQQLEYDFLVAPGADAGRIGVAVAGATSASVDRMGNLVLETAAGRLIQKAPVIYQETSSGRVAVPGRYVVLPDELTDGGVGAVADRRWIVRFDIGAHDSSRPLVIDPVLVYLMEVGGSSADYLWDMAVDGAGNTYLAGGTSSTNFPTRQALKPVWTDGPNAYLSDAFVLKLNPTGGVVFATYLGGDGWDSASAIAVDEAGSVYVAGTTSSTNFPTATPFQAALAKSTDSFPTGDSFVTKLNASGSAILFSTYLGGSASDDVLDLALDASGHVWVTGTTTSTNFPLARPLQSALRSISSGLLYRQPDAFVAELETNGSSLLFSTYLGGSGSEQGAALALDRAGNVIVVGRTDSRDFPLAPGSSRWTTNGGNGVGYGDVFVVKYRADGSALEFSALLGGEADDVATAAAVNAAGDIVVIGSTASTNFPVVHALQAQPASWQTLPAGVSGHQAPPTDGFVAKLNAAGHALLFSTYLGSSGIDELHGVAFDAGGNILLSGTLLADVTVGALSGVGFVASLNADGSALRAAAAIPYCGLTAVRGVGLDAAGDVYVAGFRSREGFLPSGGRLGPAADYDVFVAKLSGSGPQSNTPPFVNLAYSGGQAIVGSGGVITLSAHAVDLDGRLERLLMFENGVLIASSTNSPLSLVRSNLSPGEIRYTAQAIDNLGAVADSCPVQIQVVQSPPNDDFVNRILLSGATVNTTGSVLGATRDPSQADLRLYPGLEGGPVWWSWTPPVSGKYFITTEESPIPTRLRIYRGDTLSSLVVFGEAVLYLTGSRGGLGFQALAGTNYVLSVEGYAGSTGDVTLSIRPALPPSNDDFADATSLTGAEVTLSGDLSEASLELGESSRGSVPAPGVSMVPFIGQSVWWSWTAPRDGTFSVTMLYTARVVSAQVYLGSALTNLVSVGSGGFLEDAMGYRNIFRAHAGTVYRIAAQADSVPADAFTLRIAPDMAPANDNFADRIGLSGVPAVAEGTVFGATVEPGEPWSYPLYSTDGLRTVWWSWSAPSNGVFALQLGTASPGLSATVYEGTELTNLQAVAHTSSDGRASFKAVTGDSYAVSVESSYPGYFSSVSFVVSPTRPPVNDDLADAIVLSGGSVTAEGSGIDATLEPGEPPHDGQMPSGVNGSTWWTWVAPADGVCSFSTEGSSANAVLAVYSGGGGISNLVFQGSDSYNGAGGSALLYLPITAGTRYWIAVASFSTPLENIRLGIGYQTPPANDRFADRIEVAGPDYVATGSNIGAGLEAGEPGLGANVAGHTIWWTWTAPVDGAFRVIAQSAGAPVPVGVYTGTTLAALRLVGSNITEFSQGSIASFAAEAGVSYQIAVDNASNRPFETAITLKVEPDPIASNDRFVGRLTLAGEAVTLNGDNFHASLEFFEPRHQPSYYGGYSLWWSWTAPRSGLATLSGEGSDFEVVLAVYTGSDLTGLTRVANNGRTLSGLEQSLSFEVQEGVHYQIALASASWPGHFQLRLLAPQPTSPFQLRPAGRFVTGAFELQMVGEPGRTNVLEVSSDLLHWVPINTNVNVSGSIRVLDPGALNAPQRFYRAR